MVMKTSMFSESAPHTHVYISGLLKVIVYVVPFSRNCDYSLQWDFLHCPQNAVFGRPIPPKWTNFNLTPKWQTAVSLRSMRCIKHLRALPRSGYIVKVAHFLGHVTRFHGNRCCVNQKKCVFWKSGPDFRGTFFRISHRFRVICVFCLQWDFRYLDRFADTGNWIGAFFDDRIS